MNTHVTDLKILKAIHSRYYNEFKSSAASKDRQTKIYVPIKIIDLAKQLNMNKYILFGRLHHHLAKKYSYTDNDGARVSLFKAFLGKEKHCINFPYLDGVLASLEDEDKRKAKTFWLSVFALTISLSSVIVTFLKD